QGEDAEGEEEQGPSRHGSRTRAREETRDPASAPGPGGHGELRGAGALDEGAWRGAVGGFLPGGERGGELFGQILAAGVAFGGDLREAAAENPVHVGRHGGIETRRRRRGDVDHLVGD